MLEGLTAENFGATNDYIQDVGLGNLIGVGVYIGLHVFIMIIVSFGCTELAGRVIFRVVRAVLFYPIQGFSHVRLQKTAFQLLALRRS